MSDSLFRFQNLDIWKNATALSINLFSLCERLDERKLYRFAEQLRAATFRVTNNIAESSGSTSNAELASFLNMARVPSTKSRTSS